MSKTRDFWNIFVFNSFQLSSKTIICIFIVAVVWGTTFLGIKIGVETVPPWFVAGFRQFLASLILLPILLFKKELKWIGWKNLSIQFTLSTLMLIGANGLTTLTEKDLTSSLTSLISALSPVFIFIGSMIIGMEKFTFRTLIGLLMGLFGVVFIFWDGIDDLANPDYRNGLLILLLAILCWGAGTIYTKKLNSASNNLFLNLFYQFAFAGILQLIFAFIFSEEIDVAKWSTKSISAIVYLAVFGSVTAFFAYHFLLKTLLPTQVSILSYVNTIISIFLSWLILDETISAKFILATAFIICGVFVINYKPGMLKFRTKPS
ncbi:EamA family transporter [Epilithonimonas ginsengisoli]|uniref:EamA family transporter n=1 Tax=Epilithonimonas ginsengisoli TaxID=1245592 RepID=A0ABU4JKY5_9FLAO|nr:MULTISPECIES: EamA family transporter [Chryseobacterium group]MBV6881104.1 EamA family transporter [Epilithonimonas sp. FP105]MDW8550141.1 EamA family transporter [Epilithonimonas ginsengisoli]